MPPLPKFWAGSKIVEKSCSCQKNVLKMQNLKLKSSATGNVGEKMKYKPPCLIF